MKKDFILEPENASLLVIDMQDYFCTKQARTCVPNIEHIKKNINQLIHAFYQADQPVIFTRHIDVAQGLMTKWWRENLKIDDPVSMITDDLDISKGEILIKHQYDAFLNTDLKAGLLKKNIKQVVICGVLTNLCCETTARSAFMQGFEVYFISDATATYKKEMYNSTLTNLSYGFAILLNTQDVIRIFSK